LIALLAALAVTNTTAAVFERPAPIDMSAAVVSRGPHAGCVLIAERPGLSGSTTLSWVCPAKPAPRIVEWGRVDRRVHGIAIEPQLSDAVSVLIGLDGAIEQSAWTDDGSAPAWRRVLSDDDLGPESMDDRPDLDADGSPDLLQAAFDGLHAYRATDAGFVLLWSIELPGTVQRFGDSVRADTRQLEGQEGIGLWRYTRPVGRRDGRVRLTRFLLSAAVPKTCEAYIRSATELAPNESVLLPGPTPRIAFASLPGRKLEVFGEHWINVAALNCDDTGRGTPITFSVKTPLINWAEVAVSARDLTGDGSADLVLGGSTGRLKQKPMIAVYASIAGGSFAKKPLTWEPGDELEQGALLDDTRDYDGDGSIDVVGVGVRDVLLYSSAISRKSALPWDDKPSVIATVPAEWGQASFVAASDVDQDGVSELLLRVESTDQKAQKKRFALLIVDFTPAKVSP
jgi:hypothetical protein